MSSTTTTSHELLSKIDDIKEKLSTQEYIDLCNLLKKKSEEEQEENIWDQLYLFSYLEQSINVIVEEEDDDVMHNTHNVISIDRKSIIAKFSKQHFVNKEHIEEIINKINRTPVRSIHRTDEVDINNVYGLPETENLYVSTRWGFPLIQRVITKTQEYIPISFGEEKESNNEILIEYQQFIPLSIKKV